MREALRWHDSPCTHRPAGAHQSHDDTRARERQRRHRRREAEVGCGAGRVQQGASSASHKSTWQYFTLTLTWAECLWA